MDNPALAEILQLSLAERIQLVEDLWDSIASAPEEVPVTEAQRAELERRLSEHRRDPQAGLPWAEVHKHFAELL
jgi:putative addiction module component (TIGR02574 family)